MRKTAAGILAAAVAAVTFVAVATIAGSALAALETAKPAVTVAGPSQTAGTFTGEIVNGAPVYRLPAVNVTESRAAALAAIAQEDATAAARNAPTAGAVPHAAASAAVVPDRNIALEVAVAGFGTLVAIALSFSLVAARRRRQQQVVPHQPRQWVAAQPYSPAIDAPGTAAKPGPLGSPVPQAAVSLTELRAQELRARRQAATRRRADTTQPDAA